MKKPVIKNVYQTPENLRQIFRESAEKYGDKVVYKYFTSANDVAEMTYNQLYSTYNAIGTAVCDLGLQYTKIAILSENRPEWVISYAAVIGSASVVIPLDKELLPSQIENFLQYSEAIPRFTDIHSLQFLPVIQSVTEMNILGDIAHDRVGTVFDTVL